jgi:release factor glutamine methyltransferase
MKNNKQAISDIFKKYSQKLDHLDLELLIAHVIGKSREFVMAHPEWTVTSNQQSVISKNIQRRIQKEPLAHITGSKEFFGLDFEVNKHTLVPRPETELLVEAVISNQQSVTSNNRSKTFFIDIGTGSGNIIISLIKSLVSYELPVTSYNFTGIDISKEALKIAKRNAKKHKVNKKIKFLYGNLLDPFVKTTHYSLPTTNLVILANLPYLSKEIFQSAPIDVKKFEPKSALYSPKKGLAHYKKLFTQIKKLLVTCQLSHVTCYLEFSPEQKILLQKLIKENFPKSKASFQKDLAGKWRLAKIELF